VQEHHNGLKGFEPAAAAPIHRPNLPACSLIQVAALKSTAPIGDSMIENLTEEVMDDYAQAASCDSDPR
jgi:hypothetical protein